MLRGKFAMFRKQGPRSKPDLSKQDLLAQSIAEFIQLPGLNPGPDHERANHVGTDPQYMSFRWISMIVVMSANCVVYLEEFLV